MTCGWRRSAVGCGGLDDARWRSLLDQRRWRPLVEQVALRPCRDPGSEGRGVSTTLAGARCSTDGGGVRWSSRSLCDRVETPESDGRAVASSAVGCGGLDDARWRSLLDRRRWLPVGRAGRPATVSRPQKAKAGRSRRRSLALAARPTVVASRWSSRSLCDRVETPESEGGAVASSAVGCGGLDDARWRSLLDRRWWRPLVEQVALRPCRDPRKRRQGGGQRCGRVQAVSTTLAARPAAVPSVGRAGRSATVSRPQKAKAGRWPALRSGAGVSTTLAGARCSTNGGGVRWSSRSLCDRVETPEAMAGRS
ncbi:MAG: hypothetical protein JWN91_2503 [Nocardioides sp.]|nr:hypothetical protein [Nocardioides sp.]